MILSVEDVKARLQSFGYICQASDEFFLSFSIAKVTNTIKNDCNVSEIPDGLYNIAVDMVVGDFLLCKKTFLPDDLTGLDLDYAIKQIDEGDMKTTFAIGEGTQTAEQRLDAFIAHLLTYGRDQFSCFRRLRW